VQHRAKLGTLVPLKLILKCRGESPFRARASTLDFQIRRSKEGPVAWPFFMFPEEAHALTQSELIGTSRIAQVAYHELFGGAFHPQHP
jgi:hypothetical protein